MDFNIEQRISNFVQNQFPSFYHEEGETFILFMKAYYSWLEETGNPIHEARALLDYRDIDNTLEKFLEFFQKKYLYSIPFNIISNKRFLLKHILDVYRSKTNINCYKLLFRLIYNEDADVYIPGYDILKPSDGTWVEPRYLEVTDNGNLKRLVGKRIKGAYSGATAVVENFVKHTFHRDVFCILYITNIEPKGIDFSPGEKIVLFDEIANTQSLSAASTLLGSLDSISIINGGQGFRVGDVIKIVDNDLVTGNTLTYGVDGLLKVTEVGRGFGTLNYNIKSGGFGFTANATTFVYNNDATGQGGSFDISYLTDTKSITYNRDLIIDYANIALNAALFSFPAFPPSTILTNINIALQFQTDVFGTIATLTNIKTGNNYTAAANTFVRSSQLSGLPIVGSLVYDTTSNIISGTSTIFDQVYKPNDMIYLQSNNVLGSTGELHIIKSVDSNTQITLWDAPTNNSTPSAIYKAAPAILPSNFAVYEPYMLNTSNTINGLNDVIQAYPSAGNNIVVKAKAINSGFGYIPGEVVSCYLYSGISNNISVLNPGTGYSNNDKLIIAGGSPTNQANGYIVTDANGSIISANVIFQGTNYRSLPSIRVKSYNGKNAVLRVDELSQYNTTSEIIGVVNKAGIGKGQGFWSTTRSFLNSDKYIQDSYYYQDYSYEIRVGVSLNKYKNIIYDTFHHAGNELFGKYLSINEEASEVKILYEDGVSNTNIFYVVALVDSDLIQHSGDKDYFTVDTYYI
jgi:hypothetical protein